MSTQPLLIGAHDQVPQATLTSQPAPVSPLTDLQNTYRARQVRFANLTIPTIQITGTLENPAVADFFALPGHNLGVGATVKLALYADLLSGEDQLQMEPAAMIQPRPLGLFRAGADPYAVADHSQVGQVYAHWFDQPIRYQRFVLSITHGLNTATAPISDIPRQDPDSAILALEAESGTITNVPDNTWVVANHWNTGGAKFMSRTGPRFYWNATDGPRLDYRFTATASGAHDLYIRCLPVSGKNSVYVLFDGAAHALICPVASGWVWIKVKSVNLTAFAEHSVAVSARDYGFSLDRIVIQRTGEPAPANIGPVTSGFGTVASDEHVSLRSLMIGQRVRLSHSFSYGGARARFATSPAVVRGPTGLASVTGVTHTARSLVLPLNRLSEADKLALIELERHHGHLPVLVSAQPNAGAYVQQQHQMLAHFGQALEYRFRTAGVHQTELTLVES